jgi:RNA polymerase sigma-70 factor (ECF subfamily)
MNVERKERFLALLEPVYPRLSRYALAMTRDRDEAKDLVSEAVLVALERFDIIRDEAGFPGFLYRVVSRTYKRWHFRERLHLPLLHSAAETMQDTRPAPDHAAEIAIIMATLDQIPLKTRETILLFDVADLSLETIREIQGGSLSGVKSRLRRGHEQLQKLLGTHKEEDLPRFFRNGSPSTLSMEATELYALE